MRRTLRGAWLLAAEEGAVVDTMQHLWAIVRVLRQHAQADAGVAAGSDYIPFVAAN